MSILQDLDPKNAKHAPFAASNFTKWTALAIVAIVVTAGASTSISLFRQQTNTAVEPVEKSIASQLTEKSAIDGPIPSREASSSEAPALIVDQFAALSGTAPAPPAPPQEVASTTTPKVSPAPVAKPTNNKAQRAKAQAATGPAKKTPEVKKTKRNATKDRDVDIIMTLVQ